MNKQIPLFNVNMSPTAGDKVNEVLYSGFVGQGPKVEEFEQLLKDRFHNDNLATTNSATSAEHLTFHLLKQFGWIKEGEEVLTTSQTCSATNTPVVANGLKLKWIDIDPKSINIDLDDLERKISPTTKVIYLTHWGGMPNNLFRVQDIINKTYTKFGFLPIIVQDCAHAWGSSLHGKELSSFDSICTYSFQAIKHLNSVDGGMVIVGGYPTSANRSFIKKFKLQRWYGISREEQRTDFRCELPIENWGFKFHMNDVNATVGIENLKNTDAIVQRHKDNAKFYDKELANVGGITLTERKPGFDSSFWIYSLLVEDRANFAKMMKENGIMTSQVHERNDKHPCFDEFKAHLPNLDKTLPKLTHIPVHSQVSDEDRQYICDTIKKGW